MRKKGTLIEMKLFLLAATSAALLAASDAFPNFLFELEGKDWIPGNKGPMGSGKLRDGSINSRCEINNPLLFVDYKPNTMYSFQVTSSQKLGFKLKLTPETPDQEPGYLYSRLGIKKKLCSNSDMDRKTRTTGQKFGLECYSGSREFNIGYFRWKSPKKTGQRFQLNVICASGHKKKGEDGPVSYASVPYKSAADVSFATEAPTINTNFCTGFGGMKKCNAEARCKWSNKQCNLLPTPCGGLKMKACKAHVKCRFAQKKCLLKPDCDSYKKFKGCKTQTRRCKWQKKKCVVAATDSPTEAPMDAPTLGGCPGQDNKGDCKKEEGCKWLPVKKQCVVATTDACDTCRQKDGVGSCANRWKCVNEGDQCEGACILCNEDNNDACYQREMKDQT